MSDRRKKDTNWTLDPEATGRYSFEAATLAVLMDLRDELKRLNELFHCQNTLAIPHLLRQIKVNTAKPRKKRK